MKVELRIVPERAEPAVVVEVPAETPQALELLGQVEALFPQPLTGWRGEKAFLLELSKLTRFYARDKGVFAQGEDGEEYALRQRLYELEERLDKGAFVRVSHSEIVNLKKVTALDLSLGGTIKMTLTGGTVCWVSRRQVKKIKQALGL